MQTLQKTGISLSTLSEFEQGQMATDPLDLYIEKIEALASLLDCTEIEAEHIILSRVNIARRKTLTLRRPAMT